MPQVIRDAQRTGLDFIIITDHRTIAARPYEGYHGPLLVLVDEELGLDRGHYLGLGIQKACSATAPQEMIDEVKHAGGIGFIAHPHDPKYGWPDWSVTGFNGISLWNFTSQWRWAGGFFKFLLHMLFPAAAVTAPPAATRQLWDALQGDRPLPAIGCSDAHAFGFYFLGIPFTVLPYRLLFQALNTHVILQSPLTGKAAADKTAILAALAQGSSFIANDRHGATNGFRFWLEGTGRVWSMGGIASREGRSVLRAVLPQKAHLVLIRDGREILAQHGKEIILANPTPGSYRLEAYRDAARKWGWIFSNPILVK